jgi:uncharacterized protein
MDKVTIKKLTGTELEAAKVFQWPIWEKEASRFDWYYDNEEHCYILEGHIVVETTEGVYEIRPGDYVIFPKGLKCIWEIKEDVRKHYNFID